MLDYNGRNGCNAFIYQFMCVTNCPANTAPQTVNNTLNCVDCTDCDGQAVRFKIVVKIKLRALSIVLKPSQPISPNFKPQFQLILVPLNSRRLLAGGQIVIPVQNTDVTSTGIAISAVIPDGVDTSVYSGLQLVFTGLSNSATAGGALLADSTLKINLAEVQQQQIQSSKISILGEVLSVLFIVMLAIFVAYRKLEKFTGALLLLQVLYLIGFGLDPTELDGLNVLAGFSFSMLSFVPSPFVPPTDYTEATTQAILKYGVDGSLIRNAGYSLILLFAFSGVLSLFLLIGYLHKTCSQQSKLWQPELLKNIALGCYLLVALNLLTFSLFELRLWPVSAYKNLYVSGFSIAVVVVVATIGLTTLAGFKDKQLLVLQLQLIGVAIVLAFGFGISLVALLAIWVATSVGRLAIYWQKISYEKLLVVADCLLASIAIAGCIFGRDSQTIILAAVGAALAAYFVLMLYDLIFRTIRQAAQIEPSDEVKNEAEPIQD